MRYFVKKYADGDTFAIETSDDGTLVRKKLEAAGPADRLLGLAPTQLKEFESSIQQAIASATIRRPKSASRRPSRSLRDAF